VDAEVFEARAIDPLSIVFRFIAPNCCAMALDILTEWRFNMGNGAVLKE
jgi:hypothetical protein